jgi:starch synthase
MIGRLAEQKGVRHLFGDPSVVTGGGAPGGGAVAELLAGEDLQMVLLGSGDPRYEERIRRLAAEHSSFDAVIGYDGELAHLIEAGADFFLMPSEYEPCGLNQMYSMRYGTLPIVSTTGGFKDTVVDESDGLSATGFLIGTPSQESVVAAMRRAIALYRERPERIVQMRAVAMQRDFGWEKSAKRYMDLYSDALKRRTQ